ncbi:hypothetical protein Tco_0762035 [Tanacetum coccineum]
MHEEYVIRCCFATKFLAMEDDDVGSIIYCGWSSKSFLDEATGQGPTVADDVVEAKEKMQIVASSNETEKNVAGRGCTQRVKPELALIQVELPTEAFSIGWVPTKSSYMGRLMKAYGCLRYYKFSATVLISAMCSTTHFLASVSNCVSFQNYVPQTTFSFAVRTVDYPAPAPPRSTYQVASLPLDAKVECIADFLAPATSSCALNSATGQSQVFRVLRICILMSAISYNVGVVQQTADAAWGVASRVIGLAQGAITGAANVAERTVGAVKGTSVILLTHNNV